MQGRVIVNRKEPILELVPQRGHSWTIRGARARFGEVFQRARTEGPQRITRQGKEAVVMMAEEQYAPAGAQITPAQESGSVFPRVSFGRG